MAKYGLATALLVAAIPGSGLSDDSSAANPYCKLFSREYLRVVYAHNINLLRDPKLSDDLKNKADAYSDTTGLNYQYGLIYSQCVGSSHPPTLPDISESTDKAWIDFMTSYYENKILPKTDPPAQASQPPVAPPSTIGEAGFAPGTPGWNAWCQRNFPHSFDEKDGTVILEIDNKGNRVRCPG